MSNTLAIRRRIRSIKNVRQITKAMELTAAAKMHKATTAVLGARPYALRALALVEQIKAQGDTIAHPLLEVREIKRRLAIVLCSDGGLAGPLNTQVARLAIREIQGYKEPVDLILVGKKAQTLLGRINLPIIASFIDIPAHPDIAYTRPITTIAREQFLDGTYDAVDVYYNQFKSTLSQVPTKQPLLPFSLPESDISDEEKATASDIVFEPNAAELLDSLLPRLVDQLLFQILLEASASEFAARMLAMRNATDNAGDLLEDLQLTFNSIRQTSITAEMAEISASMTALE